MGQIISSLGAKRDLNRKWEPEIHMVIPRDAVRSQKMQTEPLD